MKYRGEFLFFSIILLLCGLRWAIGLYNAMDITFGDEAQYLRYGTDLFQTIHKDWGPSYNIWYKFLSLFLTDKINLFYLNYQITAIGIALLLFIFLITYHIRSIIAFWLSFCFLFSTTVMDTWPRVSHFACMVILLFLIWIKQVKSTTRKVLIVLLAFFIAAYARPELFSSFVLICIVAIYFLVKERGDLKKNAPLLIFIVVFIAAFFIIYHLPADSYKGINRTYIAFCQHYAINYVLETKAQFNPISEWIDFAHKTFGNCTNFSCILKSHPDLVWHNTMLNINRYMLVLLEFITSVLFPTKIIPKKIVILFVFCSFLFLVLYTLFHQPTRANFIESVKANRIILLFLFLFGLPSMATSILIFPRAHYLLMHGLLLIFLIALAINSISYVSKIKWYFFLILLLPFLYKSPTAKKYSYYQMDEDSKNKCNRELVNYLTKNNNQMPHTLFSNHLSLSMMLPENYADFNTEYEFKSGMHFENILEEKQIDYILVRDILLQDKLLIKDSIWTTFIQQPDSFGFKKQIFCDSCDSYLLIKK